MSAPVAVTVHVDAPAERVWELVSDLERMPEWSPETVKITWRGGARGLTPGARFRGTNRIGWRRWSTSGRVVEVDPGRSFSWDVSSLGLPVARWGYRVEPAPGGGCDVTESTEERRGGLMGFLGRTVTGVRDRVTTNEAGMRATLERIKAAAERG